MRYCCVMLVGWYLLLPGASPNGQHPSQRPMTEWVHWAAYDTASQCQDGLAGQLKWLVKEHQRGAPVGNALKWMTEGRCVSTDDPRLGPPQ